MSLLLKAALGATAIWSVVLIGVGTREHTPPPAFADRWEEQGTSVLVKADRLPQIVQQETAVETVEKPAPVVREHPKRAKPAHHGYGCHRVYYTVNRHRYWRCRR